MIELKDGINKYINFYNTKRCHSSLAYQVPDDVYFQNNNMKVDHICKIDKEIIFKLSLYHYVISGKKEKPYVA